ncbi:methyltransferase domain-containing protein [Paenibacillus sepulcri]|uniref:Methyltransferase domain-containing protein n=2 Tax=Paenibacillus sepulcri TaxID=359917 RepID=A0ABS7CC40_9BACL|nr:methyltransferase domain-containing protein [Paenibacillus sepulcri]
MRMVQSRSLICAKQHCFDLSKQGYINLALQGYKTKYNKRLFESRRTICRSGFFEPLNERISSRIGAVLNTANKEVRVLDAGCGEGSHLHSIQGKLARNIPVDLLGVGMDLSKEGISSASREYPDLIWCVADIAKCPFANEQFNFILNLLSPSNYAEFKRMLSDDGFVIKVIPEREYLQELRDFLSHKPEKQSYSNNSTIERFREHFARMDMERVRYRFPLDHTLIEPLLHMTPLSWGTAAERLKQIPEMNMTEITIDLTILIGKK